MITNPPRLDRAKKVWLAAGGDELLFDEAATALESAMSQGEVLATLSSPTFLIRKRPVSSIWEIESAGSFMVAYEIFEYTTHTDVEIR